MSDQISSAVAEAELSAVAPTLVGAAGDHPAAVLLVDLDHHEVTYANDLAAQLAPGLLLPIDIDVWSRAAGLRNGSGDELDGSTTPLRRVASGEPVHGEQVTARLGSDVSAARENLWVVGMPLDDAPEPLRRMALVVFLPLRDSVGVREMRGAGAGLQQRAVLSAHVSFSISDPNAPDNPLVWVNPAFERVTGYRGRDVIGTNCRFLQGPDTDRAAVDRIRQGLRDGGTVTEVLLNYRADGTPFWNHIVISPVFGPDGGLTHHVGVQSDITDRMQADAERREALDTARAALSEAEAANARLAALAAISQELAARFEDGEHVIDTLPRIVTEHLDGWAFCAGMDAAGEIDSIAAAHSDRSRDSDVALQLAREWLSTPAAPGLPELVRRFGTSGALVTTLTGEQLTRWGLRSLHPGDDPDAAVRVVGVPLRARGTVLGVLVLARQEPDGGGHGADDAVVEDLGLRAGIALDNVRLYARQHDAALTLQQSLLPRRLPAVDGFDIAAIYRPADGRAQIGGDWYDVLDLPSSGLGVAVGDVMGHDLGAAAAMGQLRSILRSYAWDGGAPSEVLARLHELVVGLDMASMATCAYAVIEHDDADGSCHVTYALAGHPPPMLRHADGRVEILSDALTPPIGVGTVPRNTDARVRMPAGSFLVLYTDGLIERRDQAIDAGVRGLAAVVEHADAATTARELCSLIVRELIPDGHDDDTCVLVIKLES